MLFCMHAFLCVITLKEKTCCVTLSNVKKCQYEETGGRRMKRKAVRRRYFFMGM